MYNASIPVFGKQLNSLGRVLDKGSAFAEARKLDPAILLSTRLYPDMYPLLRQAQEVMKHVRWAGALLSGRDRPDVAMPETSFADLKKSIEKTIADIGTIKPDQVNGVEAKAVALKFPTMQLDFTGESYLMGFALPNIFFHLTCTYAILREIGVELSKRDYITL
jgi:hypothetical protein